MPFDATFPANRSLISAAAGHEERDLKWSRVWFLIAFGFLASGAIIFLLLPTWTYNLFNIGVIAAGISWQALVHIRHPRKSWPWLITVFYILVTLALRQELLREGFAVFWAMG